MLQFYFHPLSPIARRVWLLLLEKQIPHQPIVVHLDQQQQTEPEFLALNPFHHVPVIVDGNFRVIESLAILDYLELRYPDPHVISTEIEVITRMRMVQMVTLNELMPNLMAVINRNEQPLSDAVQQRLNKVWQFLNAELQDQPYFGGDRLHLGDIVAGAAIALFGRLGVSPEGYPSLEAWQQRICDRPAWQQTEPEEANFQKWQRWIQIQIKRQAKAG